MCVCVCEPVVGKAASRAKHGKGKCEREEGGNRLRIRGDGATDKLTPPPVTRLMLRRRKGKQG